MRMLESFTGLFKARDRVAISRYPSKATPDLRAAWKKPLTKYTATIQPYTSPLTMYGGNSYLNGETWEMRREYREWSFREPSVKAALLTKCLAVASLDVSVKPDNPNNPKDVEAAAWVDWSVSRSAGGWGGLIQSLLLPGLIDGYSMLEPVWGEVDSFGTPKTWDNVDPSDAGESSSEKYGGFWTVERWAQIDTEHIRFKLDEYRQIIGVRPMTGLTGYIELPPQDYLIFSHLKMFENPFGISDLRAVVRDCRAIEEAIKLRRMLLANFSAPFIKASHKDPALQMQIARVIERARGSGFIVVPEGTEIDVINLATSSPDVFNAAITFYREQIVMAITASYLQLLAADAERGSSLVAKSVAELFVWWLALEVCEVINRQAVPPLVRPNYGNSVGLPRVSLGGINQAEIKAALECYKAAQDLGWVLSKRQVAKVGVLDTPSGPEDELHPPSQQQPQGGGFGGLGGGSPTVGENDNPFAFSDDQKKSRLLTPEGVRAFAVEWKPYTNPEDGRSGWISEGGEVRYTKPDGVPSAPSGHTGKVKIRGVEVTLKDGVVTDGPKEMIGKRFQKKEAPAPAKPATEEVDPKPAEKVASIVKITTPEEAESAFEKFKTNLSRGKMDDETYVKTAAAIHEEFNRLSAFPLVAKTIKARSSSGQSLKLGEDFSGETGSAKGASSAYKFGVGIRLGQVPIGEHQPPNFGGHAVDGGTDLRTQFRHEFAHEIFNTVMTKGQKDSWAKTATPFLGTNTVSRYGGTNASELLSESFAAYTSPHYKPGQLPASIEKWLTDNVGARPVVKMSDSSPTVGDTEAVEEFAEWNPYTDKKTGRSGWISTGGQVRYKKPAETKKADPKPSATDKEAEAKRHRDTVLDAVSNPSKLTEDGVKDVAASVEKLTVQEIKNHARNLAIKLGGNKTELAKRLVEAIKAKREGVSDPNVEPKVGPKPKPKEKPKVVVPLSDPSHPFSKVIAESPHVQEALGKWLPEVAKLEKIGEERDAAKEAFSPLKMRAEIHYKAMMGGVNGTKEEKKARSEWAKVVNSAAYKKAKTAHELAESKYDKANAGIREKLISSMSPKNPVKMTTETGPPSDFKFSGGSTEGAALVLKAWGYVPLEDTKENRQVFNEAQRFMAIVNHGEPHHMTLGTSADGRAWATSKDDKNFVTIGMPMKPASTVADIKRATETAVHEIAHTIENRKPGLQKLCQDFIAYRCKDEKPVKLNTIQEGYADSEEGRKDDFAKTWGNNASAYYVAKTYKAGNTEVLSMGLERLYKDPAGFQKSDPEFVAFLIHAVSM